MFLFLFCVRIINYECGFIRSNVLMVVDMLEYVFVKKDFWFIVGIGYKLWFVYFFVMGFYLGVYMYVLK